MSQNEIFNAFKTVFAEVVPDVDTDRISLADDPRDLGANSVDRIEIISETLQSLGLSVPMISFAEVDTIGEIVAIIADAEVRV